MEKNSVLFQIKDLEKLILRNLRLCDETQDKLSDSPPTPTQMKIVGYILDNIDKEIYQKDLETVLNLRRATVSGVLQAMEKRGFIERTINENDSRSKKIVLNPKAKEMYCKGNKKLRELEEIAIKDISEQDLKNFSRVINKMIENIEKNALL